ncbi:alpha/beta fold hydrolase [Cloacibacterium sp.]|uniref:alpha/beta fold hydrolase n=1 Tax=Cloacibacterium sp. TaxID=1913682 RepID=UPI0039E5C8C3
MKKILVLFFNLLIFMVLSQEKLKNLDATLSNYEYPFEVKYFNFKSQNQDLKMAYMDILPQKSNGKNVLLLHGKNFNGAYWKQTATELSKLGYRVIIPDQIGFGKSSKPSQYQYSFHQLAQNTKQILDELKIDKINVLGHSMGGMLATKFALMYPETTEKLILENPIGLEDYKTLTPYVSVDKMYQNELKQTAEDIKNYQLKFYYDNKWKPEYDEWMYLLAGWTVNKDYPLVAWNVALTYDMIFTQPVVYEFPKLKVPTLLIIGTRDRTALGKANASAEVQSKMGLYQNLGKETQKKIPNSQLVEIENIGHLPHIEAFDKFIKPLVEFLK